VKDAMAKTKTIDIIELRKITDLIYEHILDNLKIKSVEMTEDMYWSISAKNLYDIEKKPNDFGIGQLYDDLDFLRHILDDESQAVPPMMMHLAPIFQYLATQVDWYETEGNITDKNRRN
jgi:hypothetical protein